MLKPKGRNKRGKGGEGMRWERKEMEECVRRGFEGCSTSSEKGITQNVDREQGRKKSQPPTKTRPSSTKILTQTL